MGMRPSANLMYGVVIEGELDYEYVEDLLEGTDIACTYCGHCDTHEQYMIYDPEWCKSVEWDEVYKVKFDDLEAIVDVLRLCSLARDLGQKNPRPGWYLVAQYG